MDKPTYPFLVLDDGERFEFESVSQHKRIRKIVEFREMEISNLYNLALVDVKDDGSHDDMSISNNNDMDMVLATVIKTIGIFLNFHKSAKIMFMGSTESRTRLYRELLTNTFWKPN